MPVRPTDYCIGQRVLMLKNLPPFRTNVPPQSETAYELHVYTAPIGESRPAKDPTQPEA